jgi:tetratricopeptide (TPR) repeat protein
VLQQRSFQPWEGGEGQVLAAWDRASSALARRALPAHPGVALALVDGALEPPDHLGEGRHPLANTAGLHLLRGDALSASGRHSEAVEEWSEAAGMVGDFLSMSSQPFSEATFASIRAFQRLGDEQAARRLTDQLARFCDELEATAAVLDYFATSLPSLLLFTEDAEAAKRTRVTFLRAQVEICRGHAARARALIDQVISLDPNHAGAVDLLRFELPPSEQPPVTTPSSSLSTPYPTHLGET